MEKVLYKAGLFMTNRVMDVLNHLNDKNFKRRLELLCKTTGLAIPYEDGDLATDWQIVDAGSGSIQIKAGIAVFSDFEIVKMSSDSDSIAITDDSTTYTVILTRSDSEKEAGTAAVTTGSLTVTGTGTAFDDEFEVGEWIQFDGTNAANEVPLIISAINSNTELVVESVDGNGDAVALTTESGMDIYSIGRFANGYPASGDDRHIRNHDLATIVVTTSPGSYSPKITIGTVSNTGGTLTIVDQRESSLLEVISFNLKNQTSSENLNDSTVPNLYGGGTIWIEAQTNGTTVVKLDDTIDWRDRIIAVQAWISNPDATPGSLRPPTINLGGAVSISGTGSSSEIPHGTSFHGAVLWTKDGGNTVSFANSFLFWMNRTASDADPIRFYVDDGTDFTAGDLVMVKASNTYDQHAILMKVDFSPKQNHV